MRAGHSVYLVSFHPEPVPGQTIEDIARAEGLFLERVTARHPEAQGKPVVVGNCQAGWAIMLLSGAAPELAGMICIAGAPLSYWAGTRGKNPMRYMGGLFGGSWLGSLAGDLGDGKFDGAHLVTNFEIQNPSNTLWTKQYNLFSRVDTEEERYLAFERWWGGHFFLTTDEMRFIVDELFVGNKLTAGVIQSSERRRIDLKQIRAPIVVIASRGDNITPPQQALNWIPDLYESVNEIRANEQVIVYTLHETVGHLGIFVSSQVAVKQHNEFVQTIDLIDTLPPGLYEMVIEETREEDAGTDLQHDAYFARFEERTIEDILALDDGREDERAFATVARLSEVNEGLYDALLRPWVRAWSNGLSAGLLRLSHPDRLQRFLISDWNPALWWLPEAAEAVRQNRLRASEGNPLVAAEQAVSGQIERSLDAYRDARDLAIERLFFAIYQSPLVEALAGLQAPYADDRKPHARDQALEELLARKVAAIDARLEQGGFAEAVLRILLAGVDATRMVDARGARVAHEAQMRHPVLKLLSQQQIKDMAREQAFMVEFAGERALEALPKLLRTAEERRGALDFVRGIVEEIGEMRPEAAAVLQRVERILAGATTKSGKATHAEGGSKAEGHPAPAHVEAAGGE
jgi:hypothetical protein